MDLSDYDAIFYLAMKKVRPKFLYKYRPINKHTLNMISECEAYFSLPIDFNDPFDCNIVPEFIYTAEEQKEFLSNLEKNENITQKEFDDLLNNPEVTLENAWIKTIENIRNNLRIFCLSEVNNNVMMYSHYADSHKGICLEFLVSGDPFFDSLDYVRYPNTFPTFHPFHKDIQLIREELKEIEILTKSHSWCYEEEWRIIKDGPNPSNYKFSPHILSSVIFGFQTPNSDRSMIEKIVKNMTPSVKLQEAVKKNKSFELEIKPYVS